MRRFALGWLACVALTGCQPLNERAYVTQRFHSYFACQESDVSAEGDGYRVEGCGTVAHFVCFDPDGDAHEAGDEGGIVGLLDLMTERDTCILDHSEKTAPDTRVAARAATVERSDKDEGAVLKARALFSGGHLVAVGNPSKYPDRVVLTVNTVAGFPEGECTARMFIDGSELPFEQTVRHNAHEVRLLLALDHLRDVGRSLRVAGDVCGRELELDEQGRRALGLFEVRFREELARLHPSTSGGEQTPAPQPARTILPAPPPSDAPGENEASKTSAGSGTTSDTQP